MDNAAYQQDINDAKEKPSFNVIPLNSDRKKSLVPRRVSIYEADKIERIRRQSAVSIKELKGEEKAERKWAAYTKREKIVYVASSIFKGILFVIFLYLFLLSLNFMTIGFTLVTNYALKAGPVIKFILANPFAALAIGIIATAIMQNATATTSIAVTMVGARIIPDVKSAIPIIMGANIGTCVTNSFIALTLSGDPNEFKRAFSGATLNDMFNYLTTGVLLPLEIAFNLLFRIATALADAMPLDNASALSSINFMAAILNPVCDLFIRLDADAVDRVTNGEDVKEIALRCCEKEVRPTLKNFTQNITDYIFNNFTTPMLIIDPESNLTKYYVNETVCLKECTYWCMPMLRAFGDGGTGLFWIILSLIVLIGCLFSIVKVLSLLIVGPIAQGVRVAINASLPGRMKWFTQVILYLIAFALTLIVQSSNIITATLVPLCGLGIVSLQRVYVMTLGSNIGTTITGILTALTQPPSSVKKAMQVAFVFTLFNTFGNIFWLPIPFMRFPKRLARALGNIVFKYRWFLFVYVGAVYFIGPLIMFGLALVPYWIGLAIFGLPLIALVIAFIVIKILQSKAPKVLPEKLRSFDWLPIWLRSLEPYDEKVKRIECCKRKKRKVSISIERRISADGKIVEVPVEIEEEIEDAGIIPNFIRRMSAIEGLVTEARAFKRRNTIDNNSSSESEHDDEEVKEYRRRKSTVPPEALENSRPSLFQRKDSDVILTKL
jgi:solute carrier family 34 (sodium-dependent phosphate cotransporter)